MVNPKSRNELRINKLRIINEIHLRVWEKFFVIVDIEENEKEWDYEFLDPDQLLNVEAKSKLTTTWAAMKVDRY